MTARSQHTPVAVISKICTLTLQDFRGFRCKHEINTDADIVLITGPNGVGKTSLMDALLLLLTGWHAYDYPNTANLLALDRECEHASTAKTGSAAGSRQPCARFELKASVRIELDGGASDKSELRLTCESKGKAMGISKGLIEDCPLRPDGLPESSVEPPELAARLCGFFQDRIDRLFDETTRGKTLRDLFEPLPSWLSMAEEYLEAPAGEESTERNRAGTAWVKLSIKLRELEREWRREETRLAEYPREENRRDIGEALEALRPHYAALVKGQSDWPGLPSEASNEALTGYALAVLGRRGVRAASSGREEIDGRIPRKVEESLLDEWTRQIREARGSARLATRRTAEIQTELDRIRHEMERIRREYPELERDLELFNASEPGLPDAQSVFQALAVNAQRWAQARANVGRYGSAPFPVSRTHAEGPESEPGHFKRALEELAAVEPSEAGKCGQAIEAWMAPRHEAQRWLIALDDQANELERASGASRSSDEVERLQALEVRLRKALTALRDPWEVERNHIKWERQASQRKAAHQHLQRTLDAVRIVHRAIQYATAVDTELQERLCKVANQVLERFSLVEGVLPLRLEEAEYEPEGSDYRRRRGYRLRTNDGRALHHLSTGQRVQAAISLLASQNQAVSHLLPHRVILLDDVTTAYDLSNLTREAILWRQLAYGCDGRNRRQVFISSHHEDLSNHLLDLLVPPKGRSMHLIRITDWTPVHGPSYEQFSVSPTRSEDEGGAFARDLETRPWQSR